MTRDEALQLLGLGPEADADAVRTAFHRRHVELVQRITSATTVQARKKQRTSRRERSQLTSFCCVSSDRR